MQPHGKPLAQRLRLAAQQTQPGVDPVRRRMQAPVENQVAPAQDVLGDAWSRQVERAAVAGPAGLGRPVLGMQRTHPNRQAGRADPQLVADLDLARQHRAGDHDANAPQGEGPVHGQAEPGLGGPLHHHGGGGQMSAQGAQSLPGHD